MEASEKGENVEKAKVQRFEILIWKARIVRRG